MKAEVGRFRGDTAQIVPPQGGRTHYYGLTPASLAFVLAENIRQNPASFLVVTPTGVEAEDLVRDLEFFWPEGQGSIFALPAYEAKPFLGDSPSLELVGRRLAGLDALLSGRRPMVAAASAASAMQLGLPPQVLSGASQLLMSGEETDRDALVSELTAAGYWSTSLVQSVGDLSVRGGIMDVFPPGARRPIRAEFFGDLVESLRAFSALNQRSVEELDERVLLPASEVVYTEKRARAAADRLRDLAAEHGWLDLLWAPLVEQIENRSYFPGLESFLPLFYDDLASVDRFAGPDVVRVVLEPERVGREALEHWERLERHWDRVREEERPHLPVESLYRTPGDLFEVLESRSVIEVRRLPLAEGRPADRAVEFRVEENRDLAALVQSGQGGAMLAPAAARIRSWLDRDLSVVMSCHTKEQARRMAELFEHYDLTPELESSGRPVWRDKDPRFHLAVGFLSGGFVLGAGGMAVVTEDELFGRTRRVVRRATEEIKSIHLSSFQDLQIGDFVVHREHGIGQYLGLVTLEAGGRANDYMHLSYKSGDKLYVPVDKFGAVGKYIGSDDRPPGLDKLGGSSWERVKAKVKESILEMADDLLKLYAARQVKDGYAFTGRDDALREFEASFGYEETPDQLAAIDEVLKDMAGAKPMDRLVCGDVGFGKTEVALRAAYRAVLDGKQTAVLVPTTVLAEQHYQTFAERLKPQGVNVEVLSRFKKPSQQKTVLNDAAAGRIDVLVGTHRLLSKDVVFRDLGLLVVDEEHRFGVKAKEKLKRLRTEVDVLTLSATPIPRTMHMSLNGIRDLSVIETPPQDRRAIKTFLQKYDESSVAEAIGQELERGGQVFFVHNRVKDIHLVAGRFQKLMPLVRFGVAHGQMKERDLEAVMLKFWKREIDVLVTTTIIESGLDFSSANTIIINNADRFGLAQIYQLRGRVGRSDQQAYAYLFVKSADTLTRDAKKRLSALMDFSELGAGFKIALHDLQIRGAGNLLGAAQSGQIAAIGYEMYVELMEQAIREAKGEPAEAVEPELNLGLAAYIPEKYIPDTEQRLVWYRRLSSTRETSVLDDAETELIDRYGSPPPEVENLLLSIQLKMVLRRIAAHKLEIGRDGLTVTFGPSGPADMDKLIDLVQSRPDEARLSPEGRLFLALSGLDDPAGLVAAKNILQGLG